MDAQATIQALVRLIDDPDELVFQQVRDELMKFGPDVVPVLEQSWEQDYYGLLFQDRIENLIHDIQFEAVKHQLNSWLQSPDKDLLQGAMVIAKYQYPGLDDTQVFAQIVLVLINKMPKQGVKQSGAIGIELETLFLEVI